MRVEAPASAFDEDEVSPALPRDLGGRPVQGAVATGSLVAAEPVGDMNIGDPVIPGEDADFDPVPAPKTKAKRKTKRKAKKKASDADDEPRSPGRRKEPDVPRDQVILVNAKDPEDTRVVVD